MRGVSPHWRLGVAMAVAGTFGASAVSLLLSPSAHAQSIRDAVRQHVSEGLEGDPAKPKSSAPKPQAKPKRKAPPSAAATSPAPAATANTASTLGGEQPAAQPPPADAPPEEALPKRVFGKNFQLDPKIGIGYRGSIRASASPTPATTRGRSI